jgi:type IV pilus assembly protein PilB
MRPRQKIGDLLVASGTIDQAQLEAALGEQKAWGRPLGMTLVRMGFVDENTLVHTLASQLKLPVVELAGKVVNQEVLDRVPVDLAEKYRCLPLLLNQEGGKNVLYLGMEDPADLEAIDEISFQIGDTVKPVLVAPSELEEALHRHYHWAASSTNPEMPAEVESDVFDQDGEPEFIDLPGAAGGEGRAAASGGSEPTAGGSAGIPSESILRALSQLLVEKGVITRDELIDRVQSAIRAEDGDL